MSQANGTKPTFDFTKVSRQWDLAFQKSLIKSAKAVNILQMPMLEDADLKTQIDHSERMDKAFTDIESVADEQALLVSQVLVTVPESWLLDSAQGKDIDWSEPDSLDYVQSERYGELLDMLRTGEARLQAKNSPGTLPSRRKRKGV